MNKIEANIDKSDYENYPDFLNIYIDNKPLDELIDSIQTDKSIKGTIPTLVFGMDTESEEKVVWDRFLPKEGSTTYCPILMCPDDCDFYCICIVAEIQNTGNTIIWSRVGDDRSEVREAESVGTSVKWYPNFEKLEFNKEEYLKVFSDFKNKFESDKAANDLRWKKYQEEQKQKK
ncbi:MAG: hypothetical protein V4677_18530 [Bacteroidota bacterium]